ncbi:transglutaminase-like domain-containing protein [Candidatus Woesearchaeota archaeon]|nr:transglutaminase-like domain-containing protein [Candidatus Woesearchaeota archaeon]
MNEDDLIKEAEDALHELEQKRKRRGVEHIKDSDVTKKNPFTYLLGLILILLLIMMIVPFYGVKLDPEPKGVPLPSEVVLFNAKQLANSTEKLTSGLRANYLYLLKPDNHYLRNMAAKVATTSCRESDICYAKAIFYFVRDNYQYVGDPPNEYLESPFETIYMGGADCDGLSILLANLQLAVGIPTRFVFVPGHVYVQVKIDDAPKKYKQKDGWISLDPACRHCEFGEEPIAYKNAKKEYLYT